MLRGRLTRPVLPLPEYGMVQMHPHLSYLALHAFHFKLVTEIASPTPPSDPFSPDANTSMVLYPEVHYLCEMIHCFVHYFTVQL